MDRKSITGALDYRGEWEEYWAKHRLTPSFTEAKIKRVSSEIFEDGDTVIINNSATPIDKQTFIGVIVFPQDDQGFYLMDIEGDISLSELLPNYDIDECLVHYQSVKAAEASTEEGEGSSRARSPTIESQRDGSITPFVGSLDSHGEAHSLHPSQSCCQEEVEMLRAENEDRKKQNRVSEEKLHSARLDLKQCIEHLQLSETKCKSLQEEVIRL